MEQVYTPKLNVKGYAGMCLQYVDDAGNAPSRTGSAKTAFNNELKAGRIRTDSIPENVWLVGWLDFTKGQYVEYGHVFFIKRIGNSYELHDSEVHRGARQPYKSLDEILGWFKVYSPKYIGWSTHCDGREYAKKKEKVEMISQTQLNIIWRLYLGKQPSQDQYDMFVGKSTFEDCLKFAKDSATYKQLINDSSSGRLEAKKHLPNELSEVYKDGSGYDLVTEQLYRRR